MKCYLGLFFLLLSSLAFCQTELKGSPEDLRQFLHPESKIVTIHASAEKTAYSDKAIVNLVITTEAKLFSEALQANANLRKSIAEQLKKAGIAADNIKNSTFSSTPEYGFFGKKPNSYKVVNRVAVSIFSEAQLKDIAQISDQYDQVDIAQTSFEHTKKTEYEQQVKSEALDKINQQKALYEKQLGLTLTPVAFREGNVRALATAGARALEEVVVTGARADAMSSRYKENSQPAPEEPSFDEVRYNIELSVDYKVGP